MNKQQAKRIALNVTARWSVASNSYRRHALSGLGISMDDINYELSRDREDREARFRQDHEAMSPVFRLLIFSAGAMTGGIITLFVQIVDKSGPEILKVNWWCVIAAALAAGCLVVKRNKV